MQLYMSSLIMLIRLIFGKFLTKCNFTNLPRSLIVTIYQVFSKVILGIALKWLIAMSLKPVDTQ